MAAPPQRPEKEIEDLTSRELDDLLAKQDAKFQELRSQGRALQMELEERELQHHRLQATLKDRTAQLEQLKKALELEQTRKVQARFLARRLDMEVKAEALEAEKQRALAVRQLQYDEEAVTELRREIEQLQQAIEETSARISERVANPGAS